MLFGYELKKIWRRVSPLAVLVVLLIACILTMTVTLCFFNKAPATSPDVSANYATLANKINNWNTTLDRQAFSSAFNNFYDDYKTMNASTLNGVNLVQNYNTANTSFQSFYTDYYQKYINNGTQNNTVDYLLVQKKYANSLDSILTQLDQFFTAGHTTGEEIINGLKTTNNAWEDANLQNILDKLFFIQTIKTEDLTALKAFFATYPANQADYDYEDAYEYALNRYWVAIATSSKYTGELSQYAGFEKYQDLTTSTKAYKLADYRIQHAETDFATPFKFGNIFNQSSNQISLFDFVFTNMEMAMFFVVLLVIIWTASAFFTDTYQSTLISPITAGKKRSTIVVTKMFAVMLYAVLAILLLIAVYTTCGLLFFKAYISPDILFLFNGTKPAVMSAINYFVLYFLNLFFKLLPLIAVCGLFSFIKTKPFVIVGSTILIYAIILVLNLCLGSFGFYQFVPLLGLDPIRYFGTELLLSPMPSSYNILYTVPVMLGIDVILYWALIHKFRHHDFY